MAPICLGRRLPGASGDRYPRARGAAVNALLFGLAPGGVCLAGRSPGRRWALTPPFHPYRAARLRRSTLPGGYFLWHFPSSRPDWVLPSALLCGARTFLQRLIKLSAVTRPPRPGLSLPSRSGFLNVGVHRHVGERVGPLVALPLDVLDLDVGKRGHQLLRPCEKRLQARLLDLPPPVDLLHHQLRVEEDLQPVGLPF